MWRTALLRLFTCCIILEKEGSSGGRGVNESAVSSCYRVWHGTNCVSSETLFRDTMRDSKLTKSSRRATMLFPAAGGGAAWYPQPTSVFYCQLGKVSWYAK